MPCVSEETVVHVAREARSTWVRSNAAVGEALTHRHRRRRSRRHRRRQTLPRRGPRGDATSSRVCGVSYSMHSSVCGRLRLWVGGVHAKAHPLTRPHPPTQKTTHLCTRRSKNSAATIYAFTKCHSTVSKILTVSPHPTKWGGWCGKLGSARIKDKRERAT